VGEVQKNTCKRKLTKEKGEILRKKFMQLENSPPRHIFSTFVKQEFAVT